MRGDHERPRPASDGRTQQRRPPIRECLDPIHMHIFSRNNWLPRLLQYMTGLTVLEAKTKAGSPCDASNIYKRWGALVKAGHPRVVRRNSSARTASDRARWSSWRSSEKG